MLHKQLPLFKNIILFNFQKLQFNEKTNFTEIFILFYYLFVLMSFFYFATSKAPPPCSFLQNDIPLPAFHCNIVYLGPCEKSVNASRIPLNADGFDDIHSMTLYLRSSSSNCCSEIQLFIKLGRIRSARHLDESYINVCIIKSLKENLILFCHTIYVSVCFLTADQLFASYLKSENTFRL